MNGDEFINLEHQVGQHEGALDALTKRNSELEDELEVILRATNVVDQVRRDVAIAETPRSEWSGVPPFDPALLAKYRTFLKRHGSIGGVTN